MGVEIILYILMIVFWLVLIASCVYDIRNTRKWEKKWEKNMKEEITMASVAANRALEITKLQIAIDEANLNIYKTPTGKYILIPKEDD